MTKEFSVQLIRSRLSYDSRSGEFVHLPIPERTRFDRIRNLNFAGKKAGSLHSTGYVHLKLDAAIFKAHRVAWAWVYGVWPAMEIDHINGNRADNRIENLRIATCSQNRANSKGRATGLPKGVYMLPNKKYAARIGRHGANLHLGCFESVEMAQVAYARAAMNVFGEFARGA